MRSPGPAPTPARDPRSAGTCPTSVRGLERLTPGCDPAGAWAGGCDPHAPREGVLRSPRVRSETGGIYFT